MGEQVRPRITFGMIVLNGMPFLPYNLRALYPFAHQIIVVEGACPTASAFATPDGHSTDGTLETLRRFLAEEDPEGKLQLVTAGDEGHSDGFWPEKDEMSQAYARRATGNYLWQVDSDEFYRAEDLRAVIDMLAGDPDITAMTFRVRTFWGGPHYVTDGIVLRRGAQDFHRLFGWGPGYRYVTHRPPTVTDEQGRDLRQRKPVSAQSLARRGIYLYHYSFIFPFQVRFKVDYYGGLRPSLMTRHRAWAQNYFDLNDPFCIDDTSVLGEPSWLRRFRGRHPAAFLDMWHAVEQGSLPVERRDTADIERLLASPRYVLVGTILPAIWSRGLPARRMAGRVLRVARSVGRRAAQVLNPLLQRSRVTGRLARSLRVGPSAPGPVVTGDYRLLASADAASAAGLRNAWKAPTIPAAQRAIADGQLARMYRGDVEPVYRVLADAVQSTGCGTGRLIEVGSASGYYGEVLAHLLGHPVDYIGVDYSASLVGEARRHYVHTPFLVGDAARLPLGDAACDVLISGCVLQHMPDYEQAIAESARVAGQWVIFHRTPVVAGPSQRYTKLAYDVRCVEIFFGEGEWMDLLHHYGLNLVRIFEIGPTIAPLTSLPAFSRTYVCRK